MKIAQIIPSLKPTGPVNVAMDLHRLFKENGHNSSIFYFDNLPGSLQIEANKLRWTQRMNWQSFDIVHSHGLRPDTYVRRLHKQMPTTVSTIHNYVIEDLEHTYNRVLAGVFGRFWNWSRKKHNGIVMLSKDMQFYYRKWYLNQPTSVIPNTRVIDKTRNQKRIEQVNNFAGENQIIGAVSSVNSRKGLHQILAFLVKKPNWVYVHIGDGELAEMKEMAQQLGVLSRCLFLGHQPKGWEYVPAFDVFAIPSLSEGFPLSLIEAAQLEVPIVASNITVFKEIASENEVSFFDLDDIDGMIAAVERSISNRNNLVKAASHLFAKKYSPEIVLKKHVEFYSFLNKEHQNGNYMEK